MTFTVRDPALIGTLPRRDAEQSARLPMDDLVDQICERAGVDKSFVSEIVLCPMHMEIRVQLAKADGAKYVVKEDTPDLPENQRGRIGELAEEIVVWKIGT
jgi:hypothetical protein